MTQSPASAPERSIVFADVCVSVEDFAPAGTAGEGSDAAGASGTGSNGTGAPGAGGSGPALITRTLLRDLSLTLTESHISLIGANGSGKSTFLQLINGLTVPSTGRVTVAGLDTVAEGAAVRRMVGFVFSDPAAQLVMPTPVEDVELSLKRSIRNRRARRAEALDRLAELGIADLAERSVYELSSGQRQLVALASVLAVDPAILILDEPTTLLDLANREMLRGILADLVARRGVSLLTSTHDLEFACDAARTLVLADGQVIADGAAPEAVTAYREHVAAGLAPEGRA